MAQAVAMQVRGILAEQAGLDLHDVPMQARLEDLGIDSLGMVEVIFAIEETFSIEVPFNANTPTELGFDLTSVGTIIAAVERLIARPKASA